MKTKFLLPFLFIFSLAASCEKEITGPEAELPPATQHGAHTFGCLINGKPWIADFDPGVWTPTLRVFDVYYDEPNFGIADNYNLRIVARKIDYVDSVRQNIKLYLKPIYSKGVIDYFSLDRRNIEISTSKADGLGTNYRIFNLDTLYPINLNITALDTEKNFIAGTFDFRAIDERNADTINVTQGRFDVKYQPD